MTQDRTQRICIYCGGEIRKVRKGEHIVPEALGGTRTISQVCKERNVCSTCNNGVLSQLDQEVCSRSPLSIVASHELDTFVWQIWDVDHSANNLLLEATPDFGGSTLTVLPQMIFEPDGPQLRCDFEQMQQFGCEDFPRVFVRYLREAFHAQKNGGGSRIRPRRIESNQAIKTRYRYPPRVFARRRIEQFSADMSFELQYLYSNERKFALAQIEALDSSRSFRSTEVTIGSELPAVRCYYDVSRVLRGLFKIGVNLLAAFCPKTPVNHEGFASVIGVILGEIPSHPSLFPGNGFTYAQDVQAIKADNAHSFRLLHMQGNWHIYSSFFGGRIGTYVQFPGPNCETWSCADVVAPLKSNDWKVTTGNILQPLTVRIEWKDPGKIMPSIEMLNVRSEMRIQPI